MVRAQANQGQPQGKVTTFQADFSNTDDRRGGRSAHVPPGDYLLEVSDAEVVPVKSDQTGKKRQVHWIFRIKAGEAGIGEVVHFYTSLDESQNGGLWQLRNLLSDLAGGADIPKSKANVDLATKIGKRVGATLVDDEPWHRPNDDGSVTVIEKSVISMTFPADKYVGFQPPQQQAQQPAAAPAQAPAPATPQNGAAAAPAPSPVDVAAAIAQPSEDDADIPPLPVADL